ncbi:MAG: hypothetical protein WD601_08190 [Pseudohongiellaceae bacterium]
MQTSDKHNGGWADRPGTRQKIRNVLYVICGLLVLADFIIHRHTDMPLEKIPAFYAIYGFIALVAVVLLSKGLRRLVGRSENYYDKDKDDVS